MIGLVLTPHGELMEREDKLGAEECCHRIDEFPALRAVLKSYDAVINTLPNDMLVDFANRCPEHFNKFIFE